MSLRRAAALFAFVLALLVVATPAHAEPGDELTISVLTFGPGDHPFFKFGHNAILVHDAQNPLRPDRVYNFGTFGFDSPWLLIDFFKGKLRYWLSVQSMGATIRAYKQENRTIVSQELELTPSQRRQLADALAVNARPENAYYKYDYYLDNCSTRVRDAIDHVIGGRIFQATQGPAEYTWREHTMRLTADDLPVYLGLYVAMGDFIDKPVRQWEEMFLPSKLEEHLRHVTVLTPSGEKPLVKAERTILDAPGRAPLRAAPPSWTFPMLLAGAAIGGVFCLFAKGAKDGSRVARIALGLTLAAVGLVLGSLAWLFLAFWFCTDHAVAYHNENILQCGPWSIALLSAGIGLARGKLAATKQCVRVTQTAVAGSVLGFLLQALPWFDQVNGQVIALLMPAWIGAAIATRIVADEAELRAGGVVKKRAQGAAA